MIDNITLATDGSEDARLAMRAAVDLAERTGAELSVVHAWRVVPLYSNSQDAAWDDYAQIYEREARRVLGSQVDAIEALGGTVASAHLLKSSPIDAILDLCEETMPDLLVMGSRGRGRLRRALVGSVPEGVAHHIRCPVLVVRGVDGGWPPDRVVVGHDGSEDAQSAAEFAASIGGLFDAHCVLVRAHQKPPEPAGGWSAEDRARLDRVALRVEENLKDRAEDLGKTSNKRPEARVIGSDPTLSLLQVAEEEEESRTLLAVGSRGFGVTRRTRLGSVSTNLLRVARGPVLIYPHQTMVKRRGKMADREMR